MFSKGNIYFTESAIEQYQTTDKIRIKVNSNKVHIKRTNPCVKANHMNNIVSHKVPNAVLLLINCQKICFLNLRAKVHNAKLRSITTALRQNHVTRFLKLDFLAA